MFILGLVSLIKFLCSRERERELSPLSLVKRLLITECRFVYLRVYTYCPRFQTTFGYSHCLNFEKQARVSSIRRAISLGCRLLCVAQVVLVRVRLDHGRRRRSKTGAKESRHSMPARFPTVVTPLHTTANKTKPNANPDTQQWKPRPRRLIYCLKVVPCASAYNSLVAL